MDPPSPPFEYTSPYSIEQPTVGKFKRAKTTSDALNTTRALADPGYAYAVLEAYARGKFKRGRNKYQVQRKLDVLERRMPHFAADFHAVRANLGLSPSLALPPAPPPPYTKECSCACTCGALPGGTIGEALAHQEGTPLDTPLHTPGIGEVSRDPLAGAAPASPSGSETSLPRALSPTADLVLCALTTGSSVPLAALSASSTSDHRSSMPPTVPYSNPNPSPRPYWLRGGGRNRSLSVQQLGNSSMTALALSASASTTNLNMGVPMASSHSAGR